jgi:hypothetical protein
MPGDLNAECGLELSRILRRVYLGTHKELIRSAKKDLKKS